MIHLVCAWQLPKSEKEDAEVFKAAGATTIADEGPVPEADFAPDPAALDVTAPAPAESLTPRIVMGVAVTAPVPTTSADPTLSPPPSAADITAAIPDTTAEAPAEHADRTPVLSPALDAALSPALDAAPSPALDAALPPVLDADAPTDGDASVTANAIDTNTVTPPELQLEVAVQLSNPSRATQQAAALIRDQARRIHINSH